MSSLSTLTPSLQSDPEGNTAEGQTILSPSQESPALHCSPSQSVHASPRQSPASQCSPLQPSPWDYSSDLDSSDSPIDWPTKYTSFAQRLPIPSMSTTSDLPMATCKRAHPSKIPILTLGEITPEVLGDLVCYCKNFFVQKDIKAQDQVKCITACFLNICIANYIENNYAEVCTMSFSDFIEVIRTHYLSEDWKHETRHKLNTLKMKPAEKWFDFKQKLLKIKLSSEEHSFLCQHCPHP
ncbi:hypothetical protein DXG01_003157 [Tephrocybe rancida]|nr:hypothetical protein DXG01_003157 [Tephrocybe rancida]